MSASQSLLSSLLLKAHDGANYWMPPLTNETGSKIDFAYDMIFWICVAFFLIIMGAMTIFTLKYKRTPERQVADPAPTHHTFLEITWSILPLLITIVIFIVGWVEYERNTEGHENETTIDVIGWKWAWGFNYNNMSLYNEPGEAYTNLSELHLVKEHHYKLRMTSQDVIHSFYLPTFRVKKDVVPGRYSYLHITPTKAGIYPVRCTEYCGTDHSKMITNVIIHESQEAFMAALRNFRDTKKPSGTYARLCKTCHSLDGSLVQGPSFKGLWGRTQKFDDGTSLTITGEEGEAYFKQSIRQPLAKMVTERNGVMTAFSKESLSDEDVAKLLEWIKNDFKD